MLSALCLLVIGALLLDRDFWHRLQQETVPWHVAGASICVLALIWQTDATVLEHFSVHFLALTSLLLIFGLRLSCLLFVLVVALQWLMRVAPVELWAWTLISGWLVLATNYLIYLLCYHYLQRHLFVYLFVVTFLNSALGMVIYMLLQVWRPDQHYTTEQLYQGYLIFIPLAALPEALLNGMAMTLLVIYKPEWVRTFSQKIYLSK